MGYIKLISCWLKHKWKDLLVYLCFALPFLAYYLIVRFDIYNEYNRVSVLITMAIFVFILCYGLFKYLQVEYMKQSFRNKYKKRKKLERKK